MKESAFSHKIIKRIRATDRYVWKNEALYKTGFQDLTIIDSEGSKYVELKVSHNKKVHDSRGGQALLSPTQLIEIEKMIVFSKGKVNIQIWVLYDELGKVGVYRSQHGTWAVYPMARFMNFV